jgi:hypothetical protein
LADYRANRKLRLPGRTFVKVPVCRQTARNATHITSTSAKTRFFVFRDDLSRTKPPATPAMMRTSTYFTVIPEHANDVPSSDNNLSSGVLYQYLQGKVGILGVLRRGHTFQVALIVKRVGCAQFGRINTVERGV